MPRFVILLHHPAPNSNEPPHYDFMLEVTAEGSLATWRWNTIPIDSSDLQESRLRHTVWNIWSMKVKFLEIVDRFNVKFKDPIRLKSGPNSLNGRFVYPVH